METSVRCSSKVCERSFPGHGTSRARQHGIWSEGPTIGAKSGRTHLGNKNHVAKESIETETFRSIVRVFGKHYYKQKND